jgi:ketosteroid isomerase-like protein
LPATALPVATAKPAAAVPAAVPAAAPVTAPAVSAAPVNGANKDVETAVRNWAAAWAAKDMTGYLGAYGKEFDPPGSVGRKAWEEDRRSRIMGKSRISVKLNDLAVTVNGNKATVKFKQAYNADALNVSSRKTLDLVKAGDRWVIVKESTS